MAVERIGRYFFLVDSNSREEMQHTVDLEPADYWVGDRLTRFPYACDCESFQLRIDRPCRHCREAVDFLVFEMELPAQAEKKARRRLQLLLEELYL